MEKQWKPALEAILAAEPDEIRKAEIVASLAIGIDDLLNEARRRFARNVLNGDADDASPWVAEINELCQRKTEVLKHPVLSGALKARLGELVAKAFEKPSSRHGVNFL